MTIEPMGDSAFIVRDLRVPAFYYVDSVLDLNNPAILDVNASYATLGIYTSPGGFTLESLEHLLANSLHADRRIPKTHKIPVLYDGEDLPQVARMLGISESAVAVEHFTETYDCYAVGFCPGFPYLGWLPEILQGVPRLPKPRTRTEPGSVAITGKQTAIYPLPRPGGWPIVGRTPLTLVDVEDNYFPIRAGDVVSFFPLATEEEFNRAKGERL